MIYEPIELIRLKDDNDRLIDYRDTNRTRLMRHRLTEINEALSTAELDLYDPTIQQDGAFLRIADSHFLYPAMNTLY